MKVYFKDLDTFLGQVEGPVYIFLQNRVFDNYADSLLTLSSFNKYNHALEICEVVGEIERNDDKALMELLDRTLEREKQITEKLKNKGFNVLPGYISLIPIPIDRIDE